MSPNATIFASTPDPDTSPLSPNPSHFVQIFRAFPTCDFGIVDAQDLHGDALFVRVSHVSAILIEGGIFHVGTNTMGTEDAMESVQGT